jgi:hypothetical protein
MSIPSELPASAIPGVYRVDPDSGEVLATIDVGSDPQRLQPADDRMIVRTTDAIVAIDPSTNTVVQTLPNADIGPAITSAYSVDAVWICDGTRLHRYDPSTLAPLAGIDLAHDCGRVFATEDLVVASTYNDDPGESGTAEATFLDPSTNTALATIDPPPPRPRRSRRPRRRRVPPGRQRTPRDGGRPSNVDDPGDTRLRA